MGKEWVRSGQGMGRRGYGAGKEWVRSGEGVGRRGYGVGMEHSILARSYELWMEEGLAAGLLRTYSLYDCKRKEN